MLLPLISGSSVTRICAASENIQERKLPYTLCSLLEHLTTRTQILEVYIRAQIKY